MTVAPNTGECRLGFPARRHRPTAVAAATAGAAVVQREQPDAARAEQGERVEVARAAQQPPVQTVPRGAVVAAVGEGPDDLAGADGRTRGHRALDRQVGRPQRWIPGGGVGHRHHRAAGHRSGERDDAGSGGPDRGTDGRGHVHAPVPGRPAGGRRFEPAEQRAGPAHGPAPTAGRPGGSAPVDEPSTPTAARCPSVLRGRHGADQPDRPRSGRAVGAGPGLRGREHEADRPGQYQREQQPAPGVGRRRRSRPGRPDPAAPGTHPEGLPCPPHRARRGGPLRGRPCRKPRRPHRRRPPTRPR